jgi:hypothetical protein
MERGWVRCVLGGVLTVLGGRRYLWAGGEEGRKGRWDLRGGERGRAVEGRRGEGCLGKPNTVVVVCVCASLPASAATAATRVLTLAKGLPGWTGWLGWTVQENSQV